MMSIHELAIFSGISVRTLHYYDKIDLLKPCFVEQNRYRKYNDDSLRRLQQIMFYKEMDLPLKKIKDIICQPMLDQKTAIKDQKDFLIAKRNRLTKLIEQLEQILEGNDTMDFKIFEHNELEEVFRSRIMQLDEYYQQEMINTYGSIDACIERMMKDEPKIKASAIQHYGSVDKYIETLKHEPLPPKGMGKLQLKLDGDFKQIAALSGRDASDPEVQKLVDEWKETFREITGKEDITEAFHRIYQAYMNSQEIIKWMDELYGIGSTVFVGKAMEYNDINC
jgi:DNA-binding transcriptional MerR regulator